MSAVSVLQLLRVIMAKCHCQVSVPLGLVCRYTAGYPETPLQLKLRNQVGLSSDDVQQLSQQLADTAAQFAQQECVCVFNLVDECQVCLATYNAKKHSFSITAPGPERVPV